MDRRSFLGTVTAATLLSKRFALAQTHKIAKVGVQLYSVRDLMKADFEGTLQKVAAIGYKEVEFAGYFDRTPQQVKAVLSQAGLSAPSAHFAYSFLGDHWARVRGVLVSG